MKRQLTQRNLLIIQLLSQGLTQVEIAQTLAISIHTVKAHLRRIFLITNTKNCNELVAWGFRKGLLQ